MLVVLALVFPVLLLLSVLAMERVEHRLMPFARRDTDAAAPGTAQ